MKMRSCRSASPVSEPNSRPSSSSITRSSRESFRSELETLPPESEDYLFELNEEVLDVEDVEDVSDEGDDGDEGKDKPKARPTLRTGRTL